MSAPRCRFCGVLVAGREPGRTLREHAVDAHPDDVAAAGVPVGCDDPGCERQAVTILVFRREAHAPERRHALAVCGAHFAPSRARFGAITEREVAVVDAPRARLGEGRET